MRAHTLMLSHELLVQGTLVLHDENRFCLQWNGTSRYLLNHQCVHWYVQGRIYLLTSLV